MKTCNITNITLKTNRIIFLVIKCEDNYIPKYNSAFTSIESIYKKKKKKIKYIILLYIINLWYHQLDHQLDQKKPKPTPFFSSLSVFTSVFKIMV